MDEEHRAARRAFIRANHPDRGGDPATFVAGLDALEHQEPAPVDPLAHRPRVVVVDTTAWPRSAVTALLRRIARRTRPSRRLR